MTKLADRFWAWVDKSGGEDACWLWTGQKTVAGYGQIKVNRRQVLAHRLSWVLTNGPIPGALLVCHNCPTGDNPSCVNPTHLWLGTYKENTADMIAKGHFKFILPPTQGEKNSQAKLYDDAVRDIRERYARGGVTFEQLGALYGVSGMAARMAVRRITWGHVE